MNVQYYGEREICDIDSVARLEPVYAFLAWELQLVAITGTMLGCDARTWTEIL